MHPFFRAFAALTVGAMAACGGSGGATPSPFISSSFGAATPTPTPSRSALSIQPALIAFDTDEFPQQTVTVQNVTAGIPLTVTVADPTLIGTSAPVISGTTATFAVYGVAHGSTAITVANGTAAPATITTQSFACGRPEGMPQPAVLLAPASGAAGVATDVGSLYFGVYTVAPNVIPKLHLIVGTNGTLEAGALTATALPIGTPTAPPQAGATLTYLRATVPPLQSATTYRTQLYDDACQAAQVVGSFST